MRACVHSANSLAPYPPCVPFATDFPLSIRRASEDLFDAWIPCSPLYLKYLLQQVVKIKSTLHALEDST